MASPNSPRSRAPKLSSLGFSRTATSEDDDSLWPQYALPETELPGRAQQDLHARAARQRETQSKADGSYIYATQLRSWAQEFQLPSSGSPAWMTLIRSRWLIIQTTSGHLQLWDIDSNSHDIGPAATFRGLHGLVDGFCISGGAGELPQLSISTMAYCVYNFVLDLPHRLECPKNKTELLPDRSFAGWSGLKDKVEGVWAYTKRQGTTHQGFAYFDEPNAGRLSIGLACVDSLAENQNILDIQIRSDIIVVARNSSIDLYDIQSLRTTSHDAHVHHVTYLPLLKCYQSLPSPNPGFIHRARILPRHPTGLKNSKPENIFYAFFWELGWFVNVIERDYEAASTSPSYRLSESTRLAGNSGFALALAWGESGSRMVTVNDRLLVMRFADERRLPNGARDIRNGSDVNHDRVMAIWSLSPEFDDIARCLAFDEATGIAVVGMASGRVLVSDAGSAVLPSVPSDTDDIDDSEEDWINLKKELTGKQSDDPPYPEFKKWRGRANNPALDMPTKPSGRVPPAEIIPGWFSDVESYYPFANRPGYYRSIPWLIRHAAGIPFRSRCILVSSEDITWETGRNSAVIEVEVEFGAGGKLLYLVWREPGDGYLLYKFRPEVTRDNVLGYLPRGTPTMDVCEEKYWPLDFISTAQLELWDLRRTGYRS